TSYVGV
nr:Chain B, Agglutinin-like protein 5 [Candida albicans]